MTVHAGHTCRSLEQVLKTDLTGHTVFVYCDTSNIHNLLKHYKKCKERDGEGKITRGVFVMTDHAKHKCQDALNDMHVLQHYKKGTPCILKHWTTAPSKVARSHTHMYVMYDGPDFAELQAAVQNPNMLDTNNEAQQGILPAALFTPLP